MNFDEFRGQFERLLGKLKEYSVIDTGTIVLETIYKRSKLYYAVAKVPLNSIIFDQRQDFNIDGDRTKIYLSICFEFLLSWYTKSRWTSILHNEMIRMNDYESIEIDHYIELPNQ